MAENLFDPLLKKIEALKMHINILNCMETDSVETIKLLHNIKNTRNNILNGLSSLKNLLEQNLNLYQEMKASEIEVSHLMYTADRAILSFSITDSSDLSKEIRTSVSEINPSLVKHDEPKLLSLQQPSGSSNYDFISPVIEENNRSEKKPVKVIGPMSLVYDISHLTEQEFDSLPKYMVGRLNSSLINAFIDTINAAFSKKYEILSKSKKLLKNNELKLLDEYRQQKVPELKGKQYITEDDMAQECGSKQLAKQHYKFLTILRHTKKLIRHMTGGKVFYMLNNAD